QLEDLLQALDLHLGLVPVLLEACLQIRRLGGARHLGQRLQDLAFGIVDVLERIEEQVVQRLFLGHVKSFQNLSDWSSSRSRDRLRLNGTAARKFRFLIEKRTKPERAGSRSKPSRRNPTQHRSEIGRASDKGVARNGRRTFR